MAALVSRPRRRFTPEEYLALERGSSERSEFVEGEIFAMAGGSLEHDTIASNVGGLLHFRLRGTECQVVTSNMKVRTRSSGLFSYPDVAVFCGPPRFHDDGRDVLTNPKVIFEVLSPSTEEFDRGKKRILYQSIESLVEYVLIAQDSPQVERWVRHEGEQWLVSSLHGLDARLSLDSLGVELELADVYERVSFATG